MSWWLNGHQISKLSYFFCADWHVAQLITACPSQLMTNHPAYESNGAENANTTITNRNLSSHIDLHTHAGCALITAWPWSLTFWPYDQRMPSDCHAVYLPSLVLIAQVVFLLQRGHTHRHTKSQMPLITFWNRLPPAWVPVLQEMCP